MKRSSRIVLSIIMPVRNEGMNLRAILKILKVMVEVPYEVLIIYDYDSDDSRKISSQKKAYPRVKVIKNLYGSGVLPAIRTGIETALGRYILLFAADEIGPVLAIGDMLVLLKNGCDLVSCTRYAYGGRRLGGNYLEKTCSFIANKLYYRLGGILTDATTGVKMFRKELFQKLNLESKPVGWTVAFEISIKAQLEGFKLGEVPIVSIDRLFGGQSNFVPSSWIWEYLKWFIFALTKAQFYKKLSGETMVRIPDYRF
jgi:dolichol-phosphate mannosyltransferase